MSQVLNITCLSMSSYNCQSLKGRGLHMGGKKKWTSLFFGWECCEKPDCSTDLSVWCLMFQNIKLCALSLNKYSIKGGFNMLLIVYSSNALSQSLDPSFSFKLSLNSIFWLSCDIWDINFFSCINYSSCSKCAQAVCFFAALGGCSWYTVNSLQIPSSSAACR